MFEFISGMFVAYVLTWPALCLLVVLGILFEHSNWRGFAVFTALALGFSSYKYFNLTLVELATYAAAFLGIGLVFSFWRYKRHVDEQVARATHASKPERERIAAQMLPAKMWDTIVAWILVWPFSLIENLTSDIITALEMLVKKVFRGVYNKIYDSAVAKLKLD